MALRKQSSSEDEIFLKKKKIPREKGIKKPKQIPEQPHCNFCPH